jgi:predicted aldo/keto reductase-like oxidoreductase
MHLAWYKSFIIQGGDMKTTNRLNRRRFLKTSTFGVIGAGVAARSTLAATPQENSEPTSKITGYRTLGRTGFKVSDLATGSIQDEGLLAAALDSGFNYIDTAEQYPGHHKIVGNAIKGRDRKKLFIASKIQLEGEVSKEDILKRSRKALEEIGTDYLDCMMMHFPEKLETLKTPAWHEAMRQLKTEGRINYVGASHHGSFWFKDPGESLSSILLAAAEDGRFDVFLMTYNFLQVDQADKVLEVCEQKGIGTALMKTSPITTFNKIKAAVDRMKEQGKDVHPLYQEGMERYTKMLEQAGPSVKKYNLENPDAARDAAIKFCLENPRVNTVCCSMKTFDELERMTRLSGASLDAGDRATLAAYEEACGSLYCRHACGLCEPHCPHGVPVNTIMRYHHYFVAQGREREAMAYYSDIPGAKVEACTTCPGYCERACPFHVPIQGKLFHAHSDLAL